MGNRLFEIISKFRCVEMTVADKSVIQEEI
jgi:hypothetical protein